jgi:nicotinamide-nucleotide amidase
VLLTGSELLRGTIADLNTAFLARELGRHGFDLRRSLTVGDALDDIVEGLRLACDGAELLVTSGGLGPTHDDRTVEAIARVAGVPLELDEAVLAQITAWTDQVAQRFGYERERFSAGNRKQAQVPRGASVLGLAGTAPGLVLELGGVWVVVLPGVPGELRRLWARAPEHPALRELFARARPRSRHLLRLYGIGESHVADLFAAAGGDPPGVETSICARNYEIEVDVRAEAGSEAAGDRLAGRLEEVLGEHVFATDERPLAAMVLELLRGQGWTLATAESCTGGLVAAEITAVPGSSDVFAGAAVTYSNALKQGLLGVPAQTLEQHGAVSAETARAMAQGARSALGVDAAVAVTGIAGPGGGTPEKPVGLVHLCAATPAGERERRLEIGGGREDVRGRATVAALQLLRASLVTLPPRLGADAVRSGL